MDTKEKILQKAQELLLQKGYGNVNLTDLASAVNISQPALYKHFKNKENLWEVLAINWLDNMLVELFPYAIDPNKARAELVHDWFWTFVSAKHSAYKAEPIMFKLYTEYLSGKPELVEAHMRHLGNSLSAVSGIADCEDNICLIELFLRFSHPVFVEFWNTHTRDDFERAWQFVEPYFATKK